MHRLCTVPRIGTNLPTRKKLRTTTIARATAGSGEPAKRVEPSWRIAREPEALAGFACSVR